MAPRRGKGPPAKRNNLLHRRLENFEAAPLILRLCRVNLEVALDIDERKVDVRVLGLVNLAHVHLQALAAGVEAFKVHELLELRQGRALDDVRPAVGDASLRDRHSLASRRAEVGRGAAVAPEVAARLERTRVEAGQLVPETGLDVPGFVGPRSALGTGASIGVVPLVRHILTPDYRLLHPSHPYVFLFHSSRLAVVMAFAAAILAHQSPDWAV